jgi:outer membrane protein assembly factor BamB
MTSRASYLFVALLLLPLAARAGDWPGWRGPRGDGISDEKNVPLHWSKTENIAWKTEIPGRGYSSPVIWGDRIFLTTCEEKLVPDLGATTVGLLASPLSSGPMLAQSCLFPKRPTLHYGPRTLLCLDRKDGKLLWQKTAVTCPLEGKHKLNSFASSTPATDGKYVYVTFLEAPKYQAYCYDFDGNLIWSKTPGEFRSVHGFCSPPILYKDLVILNADQDAKQGTESYLVALDKKTGEEKWRTERPNHTRSYCPPLLIEAAGKKQLVFSGSKCVASYDPDTGKQIWIVQGPTEQFVASLVYSNGVLFLTYGFPKLGVMGIDPTGTGDVTNSHVLYNVSPGGGYVPSPIAHGDYFYVVKDEGLGFCYEAKTGKAMWKKERMGKHHSASPVSANGHLYFLDDEGIMWVLKPGPTFEVVAKNELGEECYASPAIAHGQMFIRTLNHLYCIGK